MDNSSKQDPKKLVVGWFSFTCSEDSTILFSELLNDHFDQWKKVVEFRHMKTIKSKNKLENLDVAFIEGAISSNKQADELIKIRDNAKYVVAVGSCACTGMPSSSRNDFTDDMINDRITYFMQNFNYNPKVRRLEEIIKVDDMVNGCPMNVPVFLEVLNKYLKLFNIV